MFADMNQRNCYKHVLFALEKIYPPTEAAAITELVFADICGITRADVIRNPETLIQDDLLVSLNHILQKLTAFMPVQYAIGHAWFYHLKLKVNAHVLIPRPETEQLVDMAIDISKKRKTLHVLDIGTGSGCIPIAIKKNCPGANIVSVDISEDALAVAKMNAIANEAEINLLKLDILDRQQWANLSSYDLIISNPPYVDAPSMALLPKEYRNEPQIALGSGTDGLDHTHTLLNEAGKYLNDGGLLIVEIGHNRDALLDAYPDVPFTWLEVESGNQFVFLLTKEQLPA
jgi:ribosomal protein L3 glutamine methyltransferase